MANVVFVAYYRVSTDRQGASGLGLDAQRTAVLRHTVTAPAVEFVEVESGKRSTNRPQLLEALQECKRRKAVLVIAKLDRLGRNVAFIATLMESGVEFVCCDNPHANRLMLHMLAAFAEWEREQISERTKLALVEAKARGTKLGNPRWEAALNKAREVHLSRRPGVEVTDLMRTFRDKRMSYRKIARELNKLNIKTGRGCKWFGATVKAILDQIEKPAPKEKNPAAVTLGRLGGLKGGKARANKLTAEQRQSIAKKAAEERWRK